MLYEMEIFRYVFMFDVENHFINLCSRYEYEEIIIIISFWNCNSSESMYARIKFHSEQKN